MCLERKKKVPRQEVTPMEKEPENIEFELEGEEYDLTEEEELHNPGLKRSTKSVLLLL